MRGGGIEEEEEGGGIEEEEEEGGGMEVWLHINWPGSFFPFHSAAENKEEDGKVIVHVGCSDFSGRIFRRSD